MANTINSAACREAELPEGAVTKAILKWKPNGVGPTPFGAINGPEAASMVLLKAHAMIECMAAAHGSAAKDPNCDFGLLVDSYKELALEGIGDMVLFAKLLVDEH
jgi:hypothetical protein